MALQVETISASVGIDTTDLKRGLDSAKKTLDNFTKSIQDEGARMNASAREFLAGLEKEAAATKRTSEAKRQALTFDKELRAVKAQLTAVLGQESAAAQQVAGKYNLLSEAQRRQLSGVREQIVAQKALQEAELQSAIAAEKAAATEVAAAEKAAAAQVAASEKAAKAAEAASARKLTAARKNYGSNLSTVGGALAGGITTPLLAGGGAAVAAGLDVQNAEAAIRARTGATGAQLAGLDDVFKRVSATVPQSLTTVGAAVAALSVRTGESGAALAALATQELNLARVTNSDVNETVKTTTQLFTAWRVSTKDQAGTLDLLYRAAEASGVKVNDLAGNLARFAPTLKSLGFGIADSAALLASFEKAGIQPQRMIFGLTSALSRLAKVGITDAHQALLAIIQQLQHAKTPMEALTEAGKLFGARMGVNVVDAIRSGKFNLEALEKTISSGSDTINKAAQDTETFGVAWGKFRNKAEVALAPLGELILKVGTQLLEALKPALDWLMKVGEAFSKLPSSTQLAILGVVAFVASIGPAIVGVGKLVTTVTELREAWIGISLVMKGSAGFSAITGGLEALGLGATAAAIPWVAAFAVMTGSVYLLLTKLEETHPALKQFVKATGDFADQFVNTVTGGRFGKGRAPERFGPLPPGSLSQSGGGGDLGADYKPRYAGPEEMAAALHPTANPAGAYADLLKKLREAEQGPAKKAKVPKLTSLQKEQAEYANAAAEAHSRLAAVLAGEDNIAGQTAAKYHLMHLNGKDDLTVTLQRIKAAEKHQDSLKRLREEIDRLNADTRETNSYAPGAKIAARIPGLSDAQYNAYVQAKQHNDQAHAAAKEETDRLQEQKTAYDAVTQSVTDLHNANMASQADQKYGPINRESLALLSQFAAHYKDLSAAQRKVIDNLYGQKLTEQSFKDLATDQEAYGKSIDTLLEKLNTLNVEKLKLLHTDLQDQISLGLNNQLYSEQDDLTQAMIDGIVARTKANEGLKASEEAKKKAMEHANKALEANLKLYDDAVKASQKAEHKTNVQQVDPNAIFGQTTLLGMVGGMAQLKAAQIKDATAQADKVKKAWSTAAQGFEQVWEESLGHLNQGFKSFFASIIQGFEQMLQQIAAKYLATQITNLFFGKPDENGQQGGGGLLGSLLGGLSGGGGGGDSGDFNSVSDISDFGRAGGGLVAQDTPYLVGEHGPELMIPSRSGRIVPHAQTAAAMAGGGGHTFNMTVVTPDANSFNRSHHQIASDYTRMMQQAARRNGR